MNKPTNRREMFLHAIATGCECPIEPVTREEMLMAEHAKREAQGGGSGGVSSWNDLTDKPFDVELIQSEPVFEGDTDGFEYIDVSALIGGTQAYAVKVTSQAVSVADLVGAAITIYTYEGEQTLELTKNVVSDSKYVLGVPGGSVVLYDNSLVVLSLPTDAYVEGLRFSTGTWFMCMPGVFYPKSVSCLTYFEKENVTPLNRKFLPDITHDDIAAPFVIDIGTRVVPDAPFSVGTYDAATFDRLVRAAKQGVLKIRLLLENKYETNFYTEKPGEISTESNSYEITPCVFVESGEYPAIYMSALIKNSVLHISMNNPEYNGYTFGILKTIAYEH